MIARNAAEHRLPRVQRQRKQPRKEGGVEERARVAGHWWKLDAPFCSLGLSSPNRILGTKNY